MTPRRRVLLDASVLIAAAASPAGGSSAAIVMLTGSETYEVFVSAEILREAVSNTRAKFAQTVLIRLYALLGDLRPGLADASADDIPPGLPVSVAPKDNHVINACRRSEVSICLTLDRRHLLTEDLRRWGIDHQIRFLTPGEFLVWDRIRDEST